MSGRQCCFWEQQGGIWRADLRFRKSWETRMFEVKSGGDGRKFIYVLQNSAFHVRFSVQGEREDIGANIVVFGKNGEDIYGDAVLFGSP